MIYRPVSIGEFRIGCLVRQDNHTWIGQKSRLRSGGLWFARVASLRTACSAMMWNLFSEGILDSLMVVSLVSFCEEKFGLELTGHEFSEENLRTIDKVGRDDRGIGKRVGNGSEC